MSTIIPVTHANWSDLCNIILPSSYKVRSLEIDEHLSLWTVYKSLYTEQVIERNSLAETIKTYSSVTLGNLFYGSKSDCRSLCSARIYASWAMADQDKINLERFYLLAGHVLFYLSHSIKLNGIDLMTILISLEIQPRPLNSMSSWLMVHLVSYQCREFIVELQQQKH